MTSSSKKITLKSCDGETFEIDEAVALASQTIKHFLIDEMTNDTEIPILNVKGNILAKVIEYCKKHTEESCEDELKKWDDEFINLDFGMLFKITSAANYLNIKSLLELACKTVADMIKHKTPEEMRIIFNIKNDFTPEEEAAVRQQNQWAFDD